MERIGVYLGSSFGVSPEFARSAALFGEACVRHGLGVVYGGGAVGLMGVLADAVLAAGGQVYGVIPRAMIAQERAHPRLTELTPVDSMHERKELMARLSDGFVALPGGIGTLDELFEMLTWLQLGLHDKPIAVLSVDGFYDPLLRMLDHLTSQGFVLPAHRAMLIVERDPEAVLHRLKHARGNSGRSHR